LSDYFYPSLIIKLTAGIGLGLLYLFIYRGDSWEYHNDAKDFTELLKNNPKEYFKGFFLNQVSERFTNAKVQPRFFFLVKIISILNLFTFSNYWINSLYFSLFSFLGLWVLAVRIQRTFHLSTQAIFFSFFLFPSFVFWSSGLLKDSIIVGIIGFITSLYIQFQFEKKYSWHDILLFGLLILVGCELKYHYIIVLLLSMLTYTGTMILSNMLKIQKELIRNILLLGILIVICTTTFVLLPDNIAGYLTDIIYISYKNTLRLSTGPNYFTFPEFQPTINSYLKNSPSALITGLFRPFVWEVHGVLALLTSLENFLIYILLLSAIIKRIKDHNFSIPTEALALWSYVLITAILMAFIAPAWGTLSRYKVGFIFFFVLLLSERNPILIQTFKKLSFLKKK
jgi:hypothetical protein